MTIIELSKITKCYELPDELWNLIKDFTLNWKRSHKQKMKLLEKSINCNKIIYERWTHFPPWPNTNDIIREEYYLRRMDWAPRPNLPLTSITHNINEKENGGGWWCGYGWKK